jgi:hypothetical protein
MGDSIIKNIEKNGIDFSLFNFEIDRFVVQSNLSNPTPAYVIFPKLGVSNPSNSYYLYLNPNDYIVDLTGNPLSIQ